MDDIFVGRQSELGFLRTQLEEARDDAQRVVLLEGAAGVGKTALLHRFLSMVAPGLLLQASGDELEAGLTYGVLEQLIADVVRQRLPWLPDHVGLPGDADADPRHVGADVVGVFGRLESRGELVIVVDDAHWADAASLQALAFALRRMRADRVLALLSVRDDSLDWLPATLHRLVAGPTGSRMRLGGLDVAGLRALSVALGVGVLSQRAAARLRDHTSGNPLHARALLEELPTAALHHHAHPLPAPRSFRMLVLARLAACPPNAERLVVAAAVMGTPCPFALASRLAEVDDPLPALEQAIVAGLLKEHRTATDLMVTFPHPLVRAAVYHDLGPVRRAALHAGAAQLVDSEAAAVRHRVAAASGVEPGLAAQVAALATRQARTGAWTAAADNLLAAARLSATKDGRERLVLEAVDHLLVGGNVTEAVGFAGQLATFADSARRDYILARLLLVEGRHADAERLLARAWGGCGDLAAEPGLGAAVAEQLALNALIRADGGQAVAWSRRALAATASVSASMSNLRDTLTIGLVFKGDVADALASTEHLPDPMNSEESRDLDGWVGRALARLWTDDLVGARYDLTIASAAYRRWRAPAPWGLIALALLAETEYRLGAWDDAIGHAGLAVSLVQEVGQDWLTPFVHAVATFPLAARGAHAAAMAHAAASAASQREAAEGASTVWTATANALVALAEGDSQAVVAALEPLRGLPAWAAVGEPGWEPWPALAAEAMVALGRWDEAETVLVPYESLAAARGRRSSLVAAARARGTLEVGRGNIESAEAAFRAGLEHATSLSMPFERALLEEALGRLLRRMGRRAAAVEQLEAARVRLARLDARPFLGRCCRELAACGRTPSRRQAGPRTTLTPQELAVARLVASGRTNRQAAAELVVSVKTIEYHLRNAYAKLGVTSRTQLTLALAQG